MKKNSRWNRLLLCGAAGGMAALLAWGLDRWRKDVVSQRKRNAQDREADDLLDKLNDDYTNYLNKMVKRAPEDIFIKANEIATHSHLFNFFCHYFEDRTPEEISYLNRYRHPLEVLCKWFYYEERDYCDWRNTMNHIVWNICSKRDDKGFALESFAQENE